MQQLKGTKTHENLKYAFAGEPQANRRYLYFAKWAGAEGCPEIAGLFRDTAKGETSHARGHLDYLKAVGDLATGLPIGDAPENLKAAMHPIQALARAYRPDGFPKRLEKQSAPR